ncbi:MAG: DNA cytosine methyltransferase [Phycisphaerae bacterium]|nr:DNA cytosine methyltransferase [Phycisphaerae bacterium]
MKVRSLCTSAGLLDKAMLAAGWDVVPGCEIMPHKRAMYEAWCGGKHLCEDLGDLIPLVSGDRFDGVVGGLPCQSFTKLKAMRTPKFPNLTPALICLLARTRWDWYLFENVVRLELGGASHVRMNAMNFGSPHQSRARWFTFSTNLTPPPPVYPGTADDLKAYSVVAGRIYGPKRGAWLQGWPEFAKLPFPCPQLQEALADGVPRCLADAWIQSIERSAK